MNDRLQETKSMMAMSYEFPMHRADRIQVRRAKQRRWATACALSWLSIVGCSRQPGRTVDTNPMTGPVALMGDAAEHPKKFESLFAAGSVPDDTQRKHFAEFMYVVDDVHPLSEAEAELHVKVLDSGGQERGLVTWTVIEQGAKWKLKSAPLP